MAGAFGYEADKYEISIACGERKLFPAVRQAEPATIVIADGFSCKEQIEQDTPRHGLHLAEVMAMAIRNGSNGHAEADYPERHFVAPRIQAQRRSMWRAGVSVLLAASAGIAASWLVRKLLR